MIICSKKYWQFNCSHQQNIKVRQKFSWWESLPHQAKWINNGVQTYSSSLPELGSCEMTKRKIPNAVDFSPPTFLLSTFVSLIHANVDTYICRYTLGLYWCTSLFCFSLFWWIYPNDFLVILSNWCWFCICKTYLLFMQGIVRVKSFLSIRLCQCRLLK